MKRVLVFFKLRADESGALQNKDSKKIKAPIISPF